MVDYFISAQIGQEQKVNLRFLLSRLFKRECVSKRIVSSCESIALPKNASNNT